MSKQRKRHLVGRRQAQTFVEYTLVIGVLISVLMAMTPMIRRGSEGLVKIVADNVGEQKNSDSLGGEFGHMISTTVAGQTVNDKNIKDRLGEVQYTYDDATKTRMVSLTNAGFTPTEYYAHGYSVDYTVD